MDLKPFYDEELVEVEGNKLTLAVDFRAIDIIEGMAEQSMPVVLSRLLIPPPEVALSGKVLWALLRRHHEDISLDQTAGLMFSDHGNRVGSAMEKLLRRTFNFFDDEEAKDENPPKRRGRSKTSGKSG